MEADVSELREVAGVPAGSSPIWQEANAFQRRVMVQRGSGFVDVRTGGGLYMHLLQFWGFG